MKRLLSFSVIATLLLFTSGCMKKDVRAKNNRLTKCDVSAYTALGYDGTSYGNGHFKTYYPENGWLKSLRMALGGNFEHVDSLFYTVVYFNGNGGKTVNATVKVTKKHFIWNDPMPGIHPDPDLPDETFEQPATFDVINGYLTKIGSTTLTYNTDGRLLKWGNFTLEYDSKGNLTRIAKKDATHFGAVIYQYDLNKKAKYQFYFTAGYSFPDEWYNFAESAQWIPVQPVNLRTKHIISWGQNDDGEDYIASTIDISDHVVDASGYLKSYKVSFGGSTPTTITNTWACKDFTYGNFK